MKVSRFLCSSTLPQRRGRGRFPVIIIMRSLIASARQEHVKDKHLNHAQQSRQALFPAGLNFIHNAPHHTSLTKARRVYGPFALQYVAGHDNIGITMRSVLSRERLSKPCLRGRQTSTCLRSTSGARNRRKVWCNSSVSGDSSELWITDNLQAEVVELADTPS
jgi:hypothetical protein